FKVVAEADIPKIKKPEPGTVPDPKAVPPQVTRMGWEWPASSPLITQIATSGQGVLLPDASQFPDDALKAAILKYALKSQYFLPVMVSGQVQALLEVQTTLQPKVIIPVEMTFTQKLTGGLGRAIENAPPALPDELKGVVKKLQKANNPHHIDFFNKTFDLVFTLILGELEDEDHHEIEEMMARDEQPPLKLWLRLALMTQMEADRALICRQAMNELYTQHREQCITLEIKVAPGFRDLLKYMAKWPASLPDGLIPKEQLEILNADVDRAVKGELFHEKKETGDAKKEQIYLINDIEQASMMPNFVSIPAAFDLRAQIKAHLVEVPEEVDSAALLDVLSQQAMREISKNAAREMSEKVLYDQEGFLEHPPDQQIERIESLAKFLHYRFMGNLIPVLRGQASDWAKGIVKALKERAKEASKQRTILVGKLLSNQDEEE
ncbi:MAG: hypothetical protein H7338_18015, partial [Candidatus Sericytochromatia bacterium]|nr:hypothetical protein [Candidatus Sericytochromatia bacterium]